MGPRQKSKIPDAPLEEFGLTYRGARPTFVGRPCRIWAGTPGEDSCIVEFASGSKLFARRSTLRVRRIA